MKKIIGLTFAILLGSSSLAFAVMTDVTQATVSAEVDVVGKSPVNAGDPCNCQETGYKKPENGLLQVSEDTRKAGYNTLLTDSSGAPLPVAPSSGAQ